LNKTLLHFKDLTKQSQLQGRQEIFFYGIMQKMGKTTKKQKLMADLRRQTEFSKNFNISTPVKFNNKESLDTSKINTPEDHHQTDSLYAYPVQNIRKDLTKTLVLCILAISFEIALFIFLKK